MVSAVQIGIVVCCLVKYTFAVHSCYKDKSISICTDGRQQGDSVSVNFALIPLHENNASCSCFIFAQSYTEIFTTYQAYSDSDIILVNTSIRLGDQTFQEASKGSIQLSANSFKKLHFNGDTDKQPPGVCLMFNGSSTHGNIEVVCLRTYDTTVPASGISICTDGRRQGGSVYVDFSSVPLYENNVSCSCYIFAQSDTEILARYKTSSDSDIILVNTSIRLGDQTFQEATKGFIQLSANSFKKLHFNGDIGATSPRVGLSFSNGLRSINIEVVCLRPSDETVPTSEFTTSWKMTPIYTNDMAEKSTIKPTTEGNAEKTMTFTTTESRKRNQLEFDDQPDNNNRAIIGGTIGGGIGIVVVVVSVVLVVKFRSGTTSEASTNQRKNDVTHNYVNTIQLSSGEDIEPSENHNYELLSSIRCDAIYDQPKSDVK